MSASVKKQNRLFWVFFGITLILWVYSFWAFLSRDVQMMSDAVSFYEHLKFYIDNISSGVYPFWDPSFSCGSPNDFFLRRIGPFNPFLLLMVIPYKFGIPYWTVFTSFITFYFFLGMIGFYKLSLEILKDKPLAIIAFVLMSFSSLSTKVFDSYLIMILTPMIWFFYFGFVFGRSEKKSALLGMVFSTMLLMTTYIPFYFIVLVMSFSVFFVLIFPKEALRFGNSLRKFAGRSAWLFLFCILAVILSCLPGVLFFKSAGQGSIVMPLRHFNAADPQVLSVKSDVTTYWAIPEELMYSAFYLEDLRNFDFSVVYVPLFAVIFLFLGMATAINRKTLLFFSLGCFLFILGSPYLSSLYSWLSQWFVFFKYFRNLHFFLWLGILPLFILFAVEQMRLFLKMIDGNPHRKAWMVAFILLVHTAVGVFLFVRESFNYSTWAVLFLSLAFFISYVYWRLAGWAICGFCFLASVVQPLEVYQYLQRNAYKTVALLAYDQFQRDFKYSRWDKSVLVNAPKERSVEKSSPLYFGTEWYNWLWNNMAPDILKKYTFSKLILYDRVVAFDEQKQDLKMIEQAWDKNLNVAFVPQDTPASYLGSAREPVSGNALIIENESPILKVVDFNVNRIRLKTNFSTKKFLVFNDCYYPGWRAYINAKEVPLIRANIAFKGLWIESGQQQVEFVFGRSWRYQLEPCLAVFCLAFFLLVLWFWYKDSKGDQRSEV